MASRGNPGPAHEAVAAAIDAEVASQAFAAHGTRAYLATPVIILARRP